MLSHVNILTVLHLVVSREITEEEFLPEVTKSKYVICHFYHREFIRCKIMDKVRCCDSFASFPCVSLTAYTPCRPAWCVQHLHALAPKYHATKFVYINAEKTPFFITKLAVRCLLCSGGRHHLTLFAQRCPDQNTAYSSHV